MESPKKLTPQSYAKHLAKVLRREDAGLGLQAERLAEVYAKSGIEVEVCREFAVMRVASAAALGCEGAFRDYFCVYYNYDRCREDPLHKGRQHRCIVCCEEHPCYGSLTTSYPEECPVLSGALKILGGADQVVLMDKAAGSRARTTLEHKGSLAPPEHKAPAPAAQGAPGPKKAEKQNDGKENPVLPPYPGTTIIPGAWAKKAFLENDEDPHTALLSALLTPKFKVGGEPPAAPAKQTASAPALVPVGPMPVATPTRPDHEPRIAPAAPHGCEHNVPLASPAPQGAPCAPAACSRGAPGSQEPSSLELCAAEGKKLLRALAVAGSSRFVSANLRSPGVYEYELEISGYESPIKITLSL